MARSDNRQALTVYGSERECHIRGNGTFISCPRGSKPLTRAEIGGLFRALRTTRENFARSITAFGLAAAAFHHDAHGHHGHRKGHHGHHGQ